jgi:hypothetical protein
MNGERKVEEEKEEEEKKNTIRIRRIKRIGLQRQYEGDCVGFRKITDSTVI